MQVMPNDTTRLIESILRQGTREDLGQWRVIDLEEDAKRRLSSFPGLSHKGGGDPSFRKKRSYKAAAARVVHGDGTYKLCHFRDDQFGKRLLQMRRGQLVGDTHAGNVSGYLSACGKQTRSDTVSGTTLRGMIELYNDDEIPLCVGCCEIIVGGFDVDETKD